MIKGGFRRRACTMQSLRNGDLFIFVFFALLPSTVCESDRCVLFAEFYFLRGLGDRCAGGWGGGWAVRFFP